GPIAHHIYICCGFPSGYRPLHGRARSPAHGRSDAPAFAQYPYLPFLTLESSTPATRESCLCFSASSILREQKRCHAVPSVRKSTRRVREFLPLDLPRGRARGAVSRTRATRGYRLRRRSSQNERTGSLSRSVSQVAGGGPWPEAVSKRGTAV